MQIKLDKQVMLDQRPDIKLISGCWLAGGCIRRWFTGEKQDSDINIFCKDEDAHSAMVSTFTTPAIIYKSNMQPMRKQKEVVAV